MNLDMQLKKRFSVRKSVAAGAMAVAMFAASMPAMASSGFGLGLDGRVNVRLSRGDDEGERGRHDDEAKDFARQVKNELKAAKEDLKAAAKLKSASATPAESATGTVQARKECRKEAQSEYAASLKEARAERDADMKAARETYLAALKAARVSFRAAVKLGVTGSASGTSATTTAQVDLHAARKDYQEAVKKAQKAFRDAKHAAAARYHADAKAARAAHEVAIKGCK